MSSVAPPEDRPEGLHLVHNRAPRATLDFWGATVLSAAAGVWIGDLDSTLGPALALGLLATAWVGLLFLQFRRRRYVPCLYWATVLCAAAASRILLTDLTGPLGLGLNQATGLLSLALAWLFSVWYVAERNLSLDSVYTLSRAVYYSAAVSLALCLGAATGLRTAAALSLDGQQASLLFGMALAALLLCRRVLRLNGIAVFWLAFILSSSFGAALGALLAEPASSGGLGLGPTAGGLVCLGGTLVLVVRMTRRGDGREALTLHPGRF